MCWAGVGQYEAAAAAAALSGLSAPCLGSLTKQHLLIKLDTPGAVYDGKNRLVTLLLLGGCLY